MAGKFYGRIALSHGEAVPGALVYIYQAGTTTLASLTDDDGNAIANPRPTDAFGGYSFNATGGFYDHKIVANNNETTRTRVPCVDPVLVIVSGGITYGQAAREGDITTLDTSLYTPDVMPS